MYVNCDTFKAYTLLKYLIFFVFTKNTFKMLTLILFLFKTVVK